MSTSRTQAEREINQALIDSSFQHISNPNVFGPGSWDFIHIITYDVKSHEDEIHACRLIRLRIDTIPCEKCYKEATAYLSENPIEKHMGIIVDGEQYRGLFAWGWKFHNFVNKRLGKTLLNYKTALRFYSERKERCTASGVCSGDSASTPVVEKKGINIISLGAGNRF